MCLLQTFVSQQLPQFSIKRLILQNVLNFSDSLLGRGQSKIIPWPTGWEILHWKMKLVCMFCVALLHNKKMTRDEHVQTNFRGQLTFSSETVGKQNLKSAKCKRE